MPPSHRSAGPVAEGILSAIGDTPLVALNHLMPDAGVRLFAKLEMFNPGGSTKARAALNMLHEKIRSGELRPGFSTVVESSSGNLAIGLAQVCRYYGLRFICVVDAKTTAHNLAILRAYHASVEIVREPDALTGEYLPARLRRVREILADMPEAYWPNQYANPLNGRAHERTMREISIALDGRIDYLFCATSSCGTVRGCSDYVRRQRMSTVVVGVDAVGSAIFGQRESPSARLIPGYGSAVRPALLEPDTVDEVIHVPDLDCIVACRQLMAREAILAGGSSGATVAAVEAMRERMRPGATCAMIFPDGGDRYLDTIFSDTWVRRHFGEVDHLWADPVDVVEADR